MTDADVDGSHIRTLLLTFFYRQMPELIERGHVYIGLPPLYKLKQGKTEMYLKDDGALNQYLIGNAVDQAELRYGVDAPPINGVGLEKLLAEYQAALDQIDRLSHRCDANLLTAMLELPPLDESVWNDEVATTAWLARISTKLNNVGLGRAVNRLRVQTATSEHPAALVAAQTSTRSHAHRYCRPVSSQAPKCARYSTSRGISPTSCRPGRKSAAAMRRHRSIRSLVRAAGSWTKRRRAARSSASRASAK